MEDVLPRRRRLERQFDVGTRMRAFVILGLVLGFAAAFVGMVVVAWFAAPLLVIGYFAVALALIIAVARR